MGRPRAVTRPPALTAPDDEPVAKPVEEYFKALVVAEQQKIQLRTLEKTPEWPKAKEPANLQERINEQRRRYKSGKIVTRNGISRRYRAWKPMRPG